jgi:hypothetical protein
MNIIFLFVWKQLKILVFTDIKVDLLHRFMAGIILLFGAVTGLTVGQYAVLSYKLDPMVKTQLFQLCCSSFGVAIFDHLIERDVTKSAAYRAGVKL